MRRMGLLLMLGACGPTPGATGNDDLEGMTGTTGTAPTGDGTSGTDASSSGSDTETSSDTGSDTGGTGGEAEPCLGVAGIYDLGVTLIPLFGYENWNIQGPQVGIEATPEDTCIALVVTYRAMPQRYVVTRTDTGVELRPEDGVGRFSYEGYEDDWEEWHSIELRLDEDGEPTGVAEVSGRMQALVGDIIEGPEDFLFETSIDPVTEDPALYCREAGALPWALPAMTLTRPVVGFEDRVVVEGATAAEGSGSWGYELRLEQRYWEPDAAPTVVATLPPGAQEIGNRITEGPVSCTMVLADLSQTPAALEGDVLPPIAEYVEIDDTTAGACAESGCLRMDTSTGIGDPHCPAESGHFVARLDPTGGTQLKVRLRTEGPISLDSKVWLDHHREVEGPSGTDGEWATLAFELEGSTYAALEVRAYGCYYDVGTAHIDRIWVE